MHGDAARAKPGVQRHLPRGGLSALSEADARQEAIDLVLDELDRMQTLLAALKADQAHWRTGAEGEAQVVEVLLDIGQAGWFVLADRRWPGTSRANLDVIVVGPSGVFVIDVKNWRDVRVESGSLWHGQSPRDVELDKLRDQCDAVEDVLSVAGFPPSQVLPVLVLAGRAQAPILLSGVTIMGERNLHQELLRRGHLLSEEQVRSLVAALDRGCPPSQGRQRRDSLVNPRRAPTDPVPAAPDRASRTTRKIDPDASTAPLLDTDDLIEAMIASACAGPIESWMTWLHPDQSALVKRSWNGPARIRGAVGTGKTVVALHRVKYLARQTQGRILVTSFVRTVPAVQRALFQRLAPDLADRVEFTHLHSWSLRLLRARGHEVAVDRDRARSLFSLAWLHSGRSSVIGSMAVDIGYWYEEIGAVIKSRGLTDAEQYFALERIGRRTTLRRQQREAVWGLFEEYERLKAQRGILDWHDVLLRARDEARAIPVTDYGAVVVDEVQDLTVVGLQLLHSLVGDRRNGLLLVGDGQQAVYPGSYTTAEAGISLSGRAAVLRQNYRNGGDILSRALQIVADDEFADLESSPESGAREVDVARPGGLVTEVSATDETSQTQALVTAIMDATDAGVRPGDIAVLCATNGRVTVWQGRLRHAGVPAMALTDYDGLPVNSVKVGTYQRAKGLEFAHVLIPDLHLASPAQAMHEPEDAYRERRELEARQLFVAMTRARDRLWLCRVEPDGST